MTVFALFFMGTVDEWTDVVSARGLARCSFSSHFLAPIDRDATSTGLDGKAWPVLVSLPWTLPYYFFFTHHASPSILAFFALPNHGPLMGKGRRKKKDACKQRCGYVAVGTYVPDCTVPTTPAIVSLLRSDEFISSASSVFKSPATHAS